MDVFLKESNLSFEIVIFVEILIKSKLWDYKAFIFRQCKTLMFHSNYIKDYIETSII